MAASRRLSPIGQRLPRISHFSAFPTVTDLSVVSVGWQVERDGLLVPLASRRVKPEVMRDIGGKIIGKRVCALARDHGRRPVIVFVPQPHLFDGLILAVGELDQLVFVDIDLEANESVHSGRSEALKLAQE